MQTSELASTKEATERVVKIHDITYEKSDLYQVAESSVKLDNNHH